jgi:hypothetical protein
MKRGQLAHSQQVRENEFPKFPPPRGNLKPREIERQEISFSHFL